MCHQFLYCPILFRFPVTAAHGPRSEDIISNTNLSYCVLEHGIKEEGKGREGETNQYNLVSLSHIHNSQPPSPTEEGYYEVVSVPHLHTSKPATASGEGGGPEEALYNAVCGKQ